MDDIKLIREDVPLRCTSVQCIVNRCKDESPLAFNKNKREKKDGKARENMVAHKENESIIDKHETEEEKLHKISKSENQCGDIVDVEV